MPATFDVDDVILNFDPATPHRRFREAGLRAAHVAAEAALPHGIPWPAGTAPTPTPLATPPAETADLSRFNGYDAVVMTWTSAEASAMATLFTPGYPISAWYEYRNDIAQDIPLVTGSNAPFNSREADMARYYHSLGLYFPCTIGGARVLLIKSVVTADLVMKAGDYNRAKTLYGGLFEFLGFGITDEYPDAIGAPAKCDRTSSRPLRDFCPGADRC